MYNHDRRTFQSLPFQLVFFSHPCFQLISLFLGVALAAPDFASRDLYQQARVASNRRLRPYNVEQDYALAESQQYSPEAEKEQLPRGARQQSLGDRRFDDFGYGGGEAGFGQQGEPQQQQQKPRYRFKRPAQSLQQRVSQKKRPQKIHKSFDIQPTFGAWVCLAVYIYIYKYTNLACPH